VNLDNSGWLLPEVLFDVWRVAEARYPAGPSFLSSLATLTEAVILHERLYLFGHRDSLHTLNSNSPWHQLYASPLVQSLFNAGIIVELSANGAEELLSQAGSHYDFADFLSDHAWVPKGFSTSDPESEGTAYQAWSDILRHDPDLLRMETLVEDDASVPTVVAKALPLLGLHFTTDDLINIEGVNRGARGNKRLSNELGLHYCGPLMSVAHQLRLTQDLARSSSEIEKVIVPPFWYPLLKTCARGDDLFADLMDLRVRYSQWQFGIPEGQTTALLMGHNVENRFGVAISERIHFLNTVPNQTSVIGFHYVSEHLTTPSSVLIHQTVKSLFERVMSDSVWLAAREFASVVDSTLWAAQTSHKSMANIDHRTAPT